MLGVSRRIYLDYAAATPVRAEAARAMRKAEALLGNPGSLHEEGVSARRSLESSRASLACLLGCKARQLVFTSGLTESNNLAILGFARALALSGVLPERTHWITTSIEHSAVLEPFAEIERLGGSVTFLDPDARGEIAAAALSRALRPETVFVSIGWANGEVGAVQKLSALARAIRAYPRGERIVFHSDAGQAPLYLSPHPHTLGADMLSLGAGKLYGPPPVGLLYARDPSLLAPVMLGGGQEKGLRGGTEKVAAAAGFAAALQAAAAERAAESKRLRLLRDALAKELQSGIPGLVVNGDMRHSLPHILNVSVPFPEDAEWRTGEYLALQLDRAGIAVSTKSACDEGRAESRVVAALAGPDAPPWRTRATIRFSLGRATTASEVRRVIRIFSALARGAA